MVPTNSSIAHKGALTALPTRPVNISMRYGSNKSNNFSNKQNIIFKIFLVASPTIGCCGIGITNPTNLENKHPTIFIIIFLILLTRNFNEPTIIVAVLRISCVISTKVFSTGSI